MAGVQTNLNAQFALYQLNVHNRLLTQALERLSSGYRINRGADDPAGLAIADKFRMRVRAYQQASRNISDAVNFARTAEDGMTEVVNLLFTMRDLAVESANSTLSTSDRLVNQNEVSQLITEIDRLATAVKFNGLRLLSGAFSSRVPVAPAAPAGGAPYRGSILFQIGPDKGERLRTFVSTMTARAINVHAVLVSSQLDASNAIAILNSSVADVLRRRATIGGIETALQSHKSIADRAAESHLEAESAIRDADIAAETVAFAREQIIVQAAAAMIAQANLMPQNVIKLLTSSLPS